MTKTTLRVAVAGGLVLIAALAFLAPPASAQTPAQECTLQVTLSPLAAPIKPLSGIGVLTGKLDFTATGFAQGNLVGISAQIKAAEFPPWAVVTVSPATMVLATNQQSNAINVVKEFKVIVATTADAPAFTPANVKVTATTTGTSSTASCGGEDTTPITADFFSIIDARMDNPIQTGRPQSQIVYPVTIQNFGNANTKVTLTVAQSDPDLTVVTPPPLTLESKQTGGKLTTTTVNVQVQTPYHNGYLNKVGAGVIKLDSYYALDSKLKGDQSQVTILTTTRGFYVPGVEIVFALGAIGALALVLRRKSA